MNAAVALLGAGTSTSAFWLIARSAAERRGFTLAPRPCALCAMALAAAPAFAARGTSIVEIMACSASLVTGVVDAGTGLIFNPLVAALLAVSIAARAITGDVVAGASGATLIGGILLACHLATKRRGIGLGDVKLGFALGAALGPIAGVIALGTAFVAGACYGLALLAAGRGDRKTAIRFGPFLAAGTFVAVLAGGRA